MSAAAAVEEEAAAAVLNVTRNKSEGDNYNNASRQLSSQLKKKKNSSSERATFFPQFILILFTLQIKAYCGSNFVVQVKLRYRQKKLRLNSSFTLVFLHFVCISLFCIRL